MDKKIKYLIGVDEVGRGPIAGPVAVCAFVMPKNFSFKNQSLPLAGVKGKPWFESIKDSKKLSAKKREKIVKEIQKISKKNHKQVGYKIAFVSNKTIDKIGISTAIAIAVEKSLSDINPNTCKVFLDGGLKAPEKFKNQETIIRGDEKIKIISLASIIAKVARDKKMCEYAKEYPKYSFEKHKGYGTKFHFENIKKYGLCDLHRKSFLKNRI